MCGACRDESGAWLWVPNVMSYDGWHHQLHGQSCHCVITDHPQLVMRPRTTVIPPSHRRRGAPTAFGLNRHHRSDTASSFSYSCVFLRGAAEPPRCHCEHGDLIELQLRFGGGATAIIGGMTAVLAATLRASDVIAPW